MCPPILVRCCSSVVEHSIGNGEVDSSILSSSTIFTQNAWNQPKSDTNFMSGSYLRGEISVRLGNFLAQPRLYLFPQTAKPFGPACKARTLSITLIGVTVGESKPVLPTCSKDTTSVSIETPGSSGRNSASIVDHHQRFYWKYLPVMLQPPCVSKLPFSLIANIARAKNQR